MPKTCVIMPAYNAEPYIERAVRSVLNQTVRELTLLAVDDGSTDQTGAILERLAAEDTRLVPLHVPNGGPAMARNRALERLDADADYVMFLDADDELLPDALAYALAGAAEGAELVLMGFTIRDEAGAARDYCESEACYSADTLGAALGRLYKANLLNQVWAKLFSARLIRDGGLRFPDYRWGEDRFFVFSCLERAARVCVRPGCRYVYHMHPGESLISSFHADKFAVCLEIDRRAQALCARFGVENDADFRYMFLKSVFSCLTTLFVPSCPWSRAQKRAAVREILKSETVRERSENAAGGLPVRALCGVLRSGSVTLTLAVFGLVAALSKAAPELFRRIKHRK